MPNRYSGNVLAFIGDGVITLHVRKFLVEKGYTKSKDLQQKSVIYVSANGQADFMQELLDSEFLSETEFNIYKRGRNANVGAVAKNASVVIYRIASGYEALIGYLYYTDLERMHVILDKMLEFHVDKIIKK
ncbi:MAG: ribonuclease III [Erysipelothrix sp.]|nr:ribonuclease III [Erysipelothrix sp.]